MAQQLPDPRKLKTVKQLGSGAFGKVYLMQDPHDNQVYAVKTEPVDAAIPQLLYEFRVYRKLLGTRGVPAAYALWTDNDQTCLALQPLGPSLEACRRRLTQWDVMHWVAPEAISAVQNLHEHSFLHRDIKPENLLTGVDGPPGRRVYLVDFGLCKRYRMQTSDHIPYREGKRLTGTVRYASIHTHLGEEQSRRDDLEALGYVFVYLLKQKLPWMNAGGESKHEQQQRVMALKVNTPLETLCEGVPAAILQYLRHVRSLSFDQAPDYALLRGYFKAAMQ